MKRFFIISLLIIMQITSFPVYAFAQETPASTGSAQQTPPFPSEESLSLIHNNPSLFTLTATRNTETSAAKHIPVSLRKQAKHDFGAEEKLTMALNNPDNETLETTVIDPSGIEITPKIQETTSGDVTSIAVLPPAQFKPGTYTVKVTDETGQTFEQDFTWGVLALNTNKSVYKPHEKATIAMAVLNESGNMICNAAVELRIKNQTTGKEDLLSTENEKITINPACFSHDFTLKPDYEAEYIVGDDGTYQMTLTAKTKNGSHTISDILTVQNTVPFDVERITATRIYPPNKYPVTFKITANQDFDGEITETVPSNFTISEFSSSAASPSAKVLGLSTESASDSAEKSATESALVRLPFNGEYKETQGFGGIPDDHLLWEKYKNAGVVGHDGVDYALPMGTPVVAAAAGQVVLAGAGDYGTTIVIQHDWGRTYYGHLSKVLVKDGDIVNSGQDIGLSGNTGLSTGPHLHFGLRMTTNDVTNGYFGKVDPSIYFSPTANTAVLGAATKKSTQDSREYSLPLTIKKGESVTITYDFLAPPTSPQFYLLGPLKFINKDNTIAFQEKRVWEIASDATWYSSAWNYRKTITINQTQVDADLTNFPMLISFTTDSDLSARAMSNGFDILFTSSDGTTKLPMERETYTSGTGLLVAWVQVPSVSGTVDTEIYMYYGNANSCDQTAASCDAAVNETDVWDANYKAVWHMAENPATTCSGTSEVCDSTTNATNADTGGSWVAGQQVAGKISGSLDFGGNDYLNSPDSVPLDTLSSALTVSMWVKGDTIDASYRRLITRDSSPNQRWFMEMDGFAGNTGKLLYVGDEPEATKITSTTTMTTGNWYYVVMTTNATANIGYMNGTQQGTIGGPASISTVGPVGIGADPAGVAPYWDGIIDEVRLSNTVRSAAWIDAEYTNQNTPGTFYSVGTQTCMTPPTLDRVMRHGQYFSACGEQPFSF